ncbi:hypothetical protein THRCLA_01158 [Thraustotheca clavata]|uniref:Lipase-like C-terminal domain-containing protein n=1 Tax=Thraustotheca clavata TaxID=74557 RepID=A0A1W0A928_9STRA|nr:hypothetical protein THRCLA_01158 [Thraustotheca clavata]
MVFITFSCMETHSLGVFGWGNHTPLFGMLPNYWPVHELNEINPNHHIVDVGKASSDHDRACEAFYQVYGGQVDYGQEHSQKMGHLRYGKTFPKETAKFPQWSEENPVHLLGHSYGATTAIELYQLICSDAFGVGSNHKWVKSIISISGPLTGSTLTNLLSAHLEKPMPVLSGGHFVVMGLGLWWKLQNFYLPWLKPMYDLGLEQWMNHKGWDMFYSTVNRVHTSKDLALYDLLPDYRVQRNKALIDMDKVHLISIVTNAGDQYQVPVREYLLGFALIILLTRRKKLLPTRVTRCSICLTILALVWSRLQRLDYSKARASLWWLMWLIRKRTEKMTPHALYKGFNSDHWVHNDGVVNTYSQLYPRVGFEPDEETEDSEGSLASRGRCDSHTSIDLENHCENEDALLKGHWHTYRIDKNHLCGTHFDSLLGWGKCKPLYSFGPNYWPVEALADVNPNCIIVDVGVASSDHDRACEVFYQLVGGKVDYGREHSKEKKHYRYGYTFQKGLHENWSQDSPIHLIGHSFGATTALELYQLICTDFFGVGSNHKWVKSIVSIAGPLSGATLGHMCGLDEDENVKHGSINHIVWSAVATLWKLQYHFPFLENLYSIRMPQWLGYCDWKNIYDVNSVPMKFGDIASHSLLPSTRHKRNAQMIEMDKVHLISIVSKDDTIHSSHYGDIAGVIVFIILWRSGKLNKWLKGLMLVALYARYRSFDAAQMPFLLTSFLRRHAQSIGNPIHTGFEKEKWIQNDGIVNTYSMLCPRYCEMYPTSSTTEEIPRIPSHVSIDMDAASTLPQGQWHVYRVGKNHFCGTRWDRDAKELYTKLFRLLNSNSDFA